MRALLGLIAATMALVAFIIVVLAALSGLAVVVGVLAYLSASSGLSPLTAGRAPLRVAGTSLPGRRPARL